MGGAGRGRRIRSDPNRSGLFGVLAAASPVRWLSRGGSSVDSFFFLGSLNLMAFFFGDRRLLWGVFGGWMLEAVVCAELFMMRKAQGAGGSSERARWPGNEWHGTDRRSSSLLFPLPSIFLL